MSGTPAGGCLLEKIIGCCWFAAGKDKAPPKGRCTCGCEPCWNGAHCGGRWCN